MSEQVKCPDCRGFGPKQKGGCPTCGGFNDGATTNPTQAERSEAPSSEAVIAAAAYRQGREEARKAIEGLRIDAPAWPDDDSYEAGLDAALSLLTDKEGEQ